MRNKEIIKLCLKQLDQLPPVVEVTQRRRNVELNKSLKFDYEIEIITTSGKFDFFVEVKRCVVRPIPEHLYIHTANISQQFILMSEYINPSIAKDLKSKQINYIDTYGNAYLSIDDIIYWEVTGKTPRKRLSRKTSVMFQPTGAKLIYCFLVAPERVNDSYRSLSNLAGISLDRISATMRELQDKGFVGRRKDKRFVIQNRENLFRRWIDNYSERFRPKLVIEDFMAPASFWENAPIGMINTIPKNSDWALTGGYGADQLIHYYRGKSMTLFISPEAVPAFVSANRLMPSDSCNVTLLQYFSSLIAFQLADSKVTIAHPLLIYAELLHGGTNRELETAKMIYERFLEKEFSET